MIAMLENGPVVADVLFNRDTVAALRSGTILVDVSDQSGLFTELECRNPPPRGT